MINHAAGRAVNVNWDYDETLASFVFRTRRGVKLGAELFTSYGAKTARTAPHRTQRAQPSSRLARSVPG